MAHKLSMTSLIVFLPSKFEMLGFQVVLIAYLIILLLKNPYMRTGDDRLALFCQIELYLAALMGWNLTYLNLASMDKLTDILLSVMLISITMLTIFLFLALTFKNMYKIFKAWKRSKLQLGRTPSMDKLQIQRQGSALSGSGESLGVDDYDTSGSDFGADDTLTAFSDQSSGQMGYEAGFGAPSSMDESGFFK